MINKHSAKVNDCGIVIGHVGPEITVNVTNFAINIPISFDKFCPAVVGAIKSAWVYLTMLYNWFCA